MRTPFRILGIYREEKYSNRAVLADKAVMDEVLNVLKKRLEDNVSITALRPQDFSLMALDFNFDLIFSMAQDESILTALHLLESRGTVVVNSSQAIRNCYRKKLSELLSDDVFSYPRYVTLDVDQTNHEVFETQSGFWIKRGDFHALVDEDVTFIEGVDDLTSALLDFKNRAVKQVILQENCEGELFKFYGVRDSFFNLRYMGKTGRDRYEFVPGDFDLEFDRTRLELLAHRAARILGLDFFGGDCIISASGKMHFIDFNDWPSFRTCLKSVAPVMVNYALKKLKREELNVNSIIHRI